MLETRRQERRTKRNLSLREKELDARLSKIERDNAVLLQTLGGIARSFGQLHRVTRGSRLSLGDRYREGEVEEGRGVGEKEREKREELRLMEPVVREMQGLVPQVSSESFVDRGPDEMDEFDEFDDALIAEEFRGIS